MCIGVCVCIYIHFFSKRCPQSCVYEAHATSMEAQYNSGGSTAYAITYRQLYLTPGPFPRRKTAEPPFTLTSSTLQHCFLNATVNCYYFKGPQNAASCQTLANLCVLQVRICVI